MLRRVFGSRREDMDALRAAFAGADAELTALRKAFVPDAASGARAANGVRIPWREPGFRNGSTA